MQVGISLQGKGEVMRKGAASFEKLERALILAGTDMPATDAITVLGEGWVGEEALAIGVYAALKAESFMDAIIIAANHDGDSDSTASIAGQIWGASVRKPGASG